MSISVDRKAHPRIDSFRLRAFSVPWSSQPMRRAALINELKQIVGERYVLTEKEDVIVYEQDGSILQVMPEIVVLPGNVEQVSAVVRAARRENMAFISMKQAPAGTRGKQPGDTLIRIMPPMDFWSKTDFPMRMPEI